MYRYILILVLFFTSCSVYKYTVDPEVGEVTTLAAPNNMMIYVENGKSGFKSVSDVLDSNDVARLSDTSTILATKSELAIAGIAQTLSITDDSIAITGGNKISRDVVVVDNVAAISGTFPNGTIIRTRGFSTVNDGAGALYQVQADSIAGYVNDDTAVIDLGGNYAVLQPGHSGSFKAEWFGAIGDKTTNITSDLQRAINYSSYYSGDGINGFQGGKLELNSNGYYRSDSIIITRRNFILEGNGGIISPYTTTVDTTDKSIIIIGTESVNAIYVTIQNLQVQYPNAAHNYRGFSGIKVHSSDFLKLENVQVGGFKYGIYLGDKESVSTRMHDVYVSGCEIGIYSAINSFSNANSSYIEGGKIFNNTIGGILIESIASLSIKDVDFSLNGNYAIKFNSGNSINLSGIYTESNGSGEVEDTNSIFILNNVSGFGFYNCRVSGAYGSTGDQTHTKYGIKLTNSVGGEIVGCYFNINQKAHVYADSLTSGVTIKDCIASVFGSDYNKQDRTHLVIEDVENNSIYFDYADIHKSDFNVGFDTVKNYIDPNLTTWTFNNVVDNGSIYCEEINGLGSSLTFSVAASSILQKNTEIFPTTQGFARIKFWAKLIAMDTLSMDRSEFRVGVVRNNGYSGIAYSNGQVLDYNWRFYDLLINLNTEYTTDTLFTTPYSTDVPFQVRFSKIEPDEFLTIGIAGVQVTTAEDNTYYYYNDTVLAVNSVVIQDSLKVEGTLNSESLILRGYGAGNNLISSSYLTAFDANGRLGEVLSSDFTSNLYNMSDTIFENRQVTLDAGTTLTFKSSGTPSIALSSGQTTILGTTKFGSASQSTVTVDMQQSNNTWRFLNSAGILTISPETIDANFRIANLANTNVFDLTGVSGQFTFYDNGGNPILRGTTANEILINSITDQGAYNLQVNGPTYIDDGSAITTIDGGTIDVDGVTGDIFTWFQLRGGQGSELDIEGSAQTATLGLFNDTGNWFINNNIGTADLEIAGTIGDFKIRTSASVYPFVVEDNAIDGAMTINAAGETLLNIADQGAYNLQVNGNSYFNASIDADALNIASEILNQGTTINTPSSTNNVVAGTGVSGAMIIKTIIRVQGSGGAVDITANPQIADGTDGQIIMLKGQSDTNTLTFDDGTGLQLAGAASAVLGLGDILTLMYDSVDDLWIEISRSDN